jgi:hypothetical protein
MPETQMQGDHGHGGNGAEAVKFGDTNLIQFGSFLRECEALTPRGGMSRIRAAWSRATGWGGSRKGLFCQFEFGARVRDRGPEKSTRVVSQAALR